MAHWLKIMINQSQKHGQLWHRTAVDVLRHSLLTAFHCHPPSAVTLVGLRFGSGTVLLSWPQTVDPDRISRPLYQVTTLPSSFYGNRSYRPLSLTPSAAVLASPRFGPRRRSSWLAMILVDPVNLGYHHRYVLALASTVVGIAPPVSMLFCISRVNINSWSNSQNQSITY